MSNTYEYNNDREWILKGQKCEDCDGNTKIIWLDCHT